VTLPERQLSQAQQRQHVEQSRAIIDESRRRIKQARDHIERTQFVIAHTYERLMAVRVRAPQGC